MGVQGRRTPGSSLRKVLRCRYVARTALVYLEQFYREGDGDQLDKH
jgi:hypothetical protein